MSSGSLPVKSPRGLLGDQTVLNSLQDQCVISNPEFYQG